MTIASKESVSTIIKKLKNGKNSRNSMATTSRKISSHKSKFHKK